MLTTERWRLDPLRVEDAEEMAPLLDDVALHQWIGGEPATVDELRERYARMVVGASPDDSQGWLNWVVRREGEALGYVQATLVRRRSRLVAEVAWVIATRFQRQGVATEAAAGMVQWLREHGVTELTAAIHPDNVGSQRVAQHLGLRATDEVHDGEVIWSSSVTERGRGRAAVGTFVFFLVAPCVVAGFIPWLLTGWKPEGSTAWWPVRIVGLVILLASAAVLVDAFVRFVREGIGTPAPVAPTQHLVVGGLYRYVRNPMYVAVVGAILGQALLLVQLVLIAYGVVVWAVVAAFVKGYEEPTLSRQFGAEYDAYRTAVPAWLPRRTPWRPDD